MIQYLLTIKKKDARNPEIKGSHNQSKYGRLSEAACKVWKFYLGQPKKIVRIVVFCACFITVVFQLTQCFKKLTNPPISTHTRVLVNVTMTYPSITICQKPSYKRSVLKKYGLGSSMRWTSEWKNFPFGNTTLSSFWEEATYPAKDVIVVYGLNRKPENVEIRSSNNYLSGKCYTLEPLVTTTMAGVSVGYSLLLKHTNPKTEGAGWQVFIHETNEPWTESGFQHSGMSEDFWLDVDEELQLKIAAQHIRTISRKYNLCENDMSYSGTKCESFCRWRNLVGTVGCTAPWLASKGNRTDSGPSSFKECDNYHDTRELIVSYLKQAGLSSVVSAVNDGDNDTKENGIAYGCRRACHRPCYETLYTTFVTNRKSLSDSNANKFSGVKCDLNALRATARQNHSVDEDVHGDIVLSMENNAAVNEINSPKQRTSDVDFDTGKKAEFPGKRTLLREILSHGFHGGRRRCVRDLEEDVLSKVRENFNQTASFKKKYQDGSSSDAKEISNRTMPFLFEQAAQYSKLKVFYTSQVVTSIEEQWGYDFTQFVADAGGSLGFILGMSVVGAVGILEQMAEALVSSMTKSKKSSYEGGNPENKSAIAVLEECSVVPYDEVKH